MSQTEANAFLNKLLGSLADSTLHHEKPPIYTDEEIEEYSNIRVDYDENSLPEMPTLVTEEDLNECYKILERFYSDQSATLLVPIKPTKTIKELITEYCLINDRSESPRAIQKCRTLHRLLSIFVDDLKTNRPEKITKRKLKAYNSKLEERVNRSCYNGVVTEVKSFLSWLYHNNIIREDLSLVSFPQKKSLTNYVKHTYSNSIISKHFKQAYSDKDLTTLFNSQYYANPTSKFSFSHPYQYWIPLLTIFTGATVNELSQLQVKDVRNIGNRIALFINDIDTGKTLRNKSATRMLPIPQKLIDLGFKDYVEERRLSRDIMLFANISLGKDGWGTQPAKWFGNHKKELGLDDTKTLPALRSVFYHSLKGKGYHDKEIVSLLGMSEDITPPNKLTKLERLFRSNCEFVDSLSYDFLGEVKSYKDYIFRNGRDRKKI